MPRSRFESYLAHYRAEHTRFGTRLTHVVGIPLIVLSLPVMLARWPVGLALFAMGWILQAIGHRIEGNKPAFFANPLYLLVGVAWVGIELAGWLGWGKKVKPR